MGRSTLQNYSDWIPQQIGEKTLNNVHHALFDDNSDFISNTGTKDGTERIQKALNSLWNYISKKQVTITQNNNNFVENLRKHLHEKLQELIIKEVMVAGIYAQYPNDIKRRTAMYNENKLAPGAIGEEIVAKMLQTAFAELLYENNGNDFYKVLEGLSQIQQTGSKSIFLSLEESVKKIFEKLKKKVAGQIKPDIMVNFKDNNAKNLNIQFSKGAPDEIKEAFETLLQANISVKNYSSNKNIKIGETKYVNAVTSVMNKLKTKQILSSNRIIEKYILIANALDTGKIKTVDNLEKYKKTIEHIRHIRLLYELFGTGQSFLNEQKEIVELKNLDYIIIVNPTAIAASINNSSNNIAVFTVISPKQILDSVLGKINSNTLEINIDKILNSQKSLQT